MSKQYVRNTWVNDSAPAINETNLNNVEDGTEVNNRLDLAVIKNLTVDANYTLLILENQYGNITITDTGVALTEPVDIIMNSDEHTFVFTNSTAQTLTVKITATTGVSVLAGESKKLRNNTVDVIVSEDVVPPGKILQVVSVTLSTTFSTSSTTLVNTPITANITPSSTSSKILVLGNMSLSVATDGYSGYGIDRAASPIGLGSAAGSRVAVHGGTSRMDADGVHTSPVNYLDSPASVAALTYTLTLEARSGRTIYLNRTANDADAQYTVRPVSTITLMEIGV